MIPIFERDPDQSNVPPDHTAFLIRDWTSWFSEGTRVEKVGVKFGLPHLYITGDATSGGGPASEPTVSRVFVRNSAEIDPDVFGIPAPPIPKRRLERDYVQDDAPPGYSAYIFRWYLSVLERAVATRVERHGIRLVFTFEQRGIERAAARAGEESRLFIKNDGIDPRALELLAPFPATNDAPAFLPHDFRSNLKP